MTDLLPAKPRGERFDLDAKYRAEGGSFFFTGVQALVRVPMDQMRIDRRAGHHRAAFISGYRGSPLGGDDRELIAHQALCDDLSIVHQSGLNEELSRDCVLATMSKVEVTEEHVPVARLLADSNVVTGPRGMAVTEYGWTDRPAVDGRRSVAPDRGGRVGQAIDALVAVIGDVADVEYQTAYAVEMLGQIETADTLLSSAMSHYVEVGRPDAAVRA